MEALVDRALAFGRSARNEKGGCPEYLSYVMEVGYLCRLRGIETITLTDAHEMADGIMTNRRKGSRDNIVRCTPRLRAAWEGAKAYRAKVWAIRDEGFSYAWPLPSRDLPALSGKKSYRSKAQTLSIKADVCQ
ncbi:Prophage PSPPH06, site-specific recombinase phage integrase protein [Pseudomonas coronafaciens pv. zizaniae]|nr:Prophage PSPPH06, site-specific recombinase phage integrase protein [Pseudomonas coronafaciens pv. zizaniae]